MKRKEQYADEIIEILERTKCGAWASNINLNTKDRVIEVCQNCVDSWSGRKFKDHCTTPPQALEQTRWIPVSERLPDTDDYVLCWYEYYHWSQEKVLPEYGLGCYLRETSAWFGEVANGKDVRVIAWMPLPQPYNGESEVSNETCD